MSQTDAVRSTGTVAPGFEVVRFAFEGVLDASPLGGAAVAISIDGRPVVDLWGGSRSIRPSESWEEGTASVFFSMTKGLLALLVARLVEQGRIDLDAPVVRYWPEFGQAGKGAITVRQLMAHRAGLSYPVEDLTRDDLLAWDPVTAALAAQAPLWTPGTGHQYHALTLGWLVGEIVRRVTGETVGQAFARIVANPVGADAWIGLPEREQARVAVLAASEGFTAVVPEGIPFRNELQRSLTLGGGLPDDIVGDGTGLNDPELQRAEIPAGLGIGTARSLAALWSSAIVDTADTTAIDPALLDNMTAPLSFGPPVFSVPMMPQEAWATGFNVPSDPMPMLGPSSFGHGGAGGQLSFADRDARLAFAFLTNDLQAVDDHRVAVLVRALHTALGSGRESDSQIET